MDGFEAARLKVQKRLERQAKHREVTPPLPQVEPQPETPKEKPVVADNSAVITVWVQLPDQAYSMKFVKPAVYQNAVRAKLTKQAIGNAIAEGLRPLLGSVKGV